MNGDNPNQDIDEVERILREYQQKKSERELGRETPNDDFLPPPVRRDEVIDFSAFENKPVEAVPTVEEEKPRKRKKTDEELAAEKERRAEKAAALKEKSKALLPKLRAVLSNKKLIAVVAAIVLVVGGAFIAKAVIDNSRTAYLRPYEDKYKVEFPEGILEKYCDYYGKNQNTVGYIEIKDAELASPVYSKKAKCYPAAETPAKNAEQGNFVVYTDDKGLEDIYATAKGYNEASGEILYSDLFNDYSFRVVGAFYTNVNPKDDNGYVFPYNTAEKLTSDSAKSMSDRVQSRLLYDVGITLTRGDRFIFVSAPARLEGNFRFVVVGVQREDMSSKLTAKEKRDTDIHYPQAICDSKGLNNPYKLSQEWYPEYEVVQPDTDTARVVKTKAEDYISKHPSFIKKFSKIKK